MISRHITGNFELNVRITSAEAAPSSIIRFSGDGDASGVLLNIDGQGFRVVRQVGGKSTVLKEYPDSGPPPWEVRLLKRVTTSGSSSTGYRAGSAVRRVNGTKCTNRGKTCWNWMDLRGAP